LLSIVDRVRRIVANGCERPDAGMVGRELANWIGGARIADDQKGLGHERSLSPQPRKQVI